MKKIKPHTVLTFFSLLLVLWSSEIPAQPPQTTVEEVEHAFQSMMELWSYGAFWTLWEHGTERTRRQYPQDSFAKLMEARLLRPAPSWKRVQDLQVTLESSQRATVFARMGFEGQRSSQEFAAAVTFHLEREAGEWRISLNQLLSTPPEFFFFRHGRRRHLLPIQPSPRVVRPFRGQP